MQLSSLLKSVSGLLLVSGGGVFAQFILIKLLSEQVESNLVYVLASLEICAAMSVCISVVGGEFSFLNFFFKKDSLQERLNILSGYLFLTLAVFFLICTPILIFCVFLFWGGWEVLGVFLLYGMVSVFLLVVSLFFRAQSKFFLSGALEKLPVFVLLFFFVVCNFFAFGIDFYNVVLLSSLACLTLVCFLLAFLFFRSSYRGAVGRGEYIAECINSTLPMFRDRSARKVSATNVLVFLYERGDQVLIGLMLGPVAMAAYYVCYKVSFFVRFFAKMVNRIFYTYISKKVNSSAGCEKEPVGVSRLIRFNLDANSLVSFLFSLAVFVFSERILGYLNINDGEYVLVLKVLALSLYLSSLNQVYFNYINASSSGDLYFSNAVQVTLAQFVLFFCLVPFFGVLGVALAKLLSVLWGMVNSFRYMRRIGGPAVSGFLYPAFGVFLFLTFFVQWVI